MDDAITCLEVRRDDLRTTRLASSERPVLGGGRALLRIDRFALTANNVTYAVAGDMIGYWDFFPADDGWGRIPVWGFADVVDVDDDVTELETGTRVFGYFPMASHLVVEPTRIGPHGFADGAAHRAHLPGVYNRYASTAADPLHSAETEDLQAVFFPLFVTSFVLDDFLADHGDFGAAQVVLSSASSKTAAGTALCIERRESDRPDIVGLTSPAHVDFVTGLGSYDRVLTYDEITSLDASKPTVFVDVAGNAAVRHAVHEHLGDALVHSCTVGMTHWEGSGIDAPLPGPAPTMFFAPSQIEKRIADWGQAGYQQRLAAAWATLLGVVDDWVDVVELQGLEALRRVYLELLDGTTNPDEAFVAVIGS